MNFGDKASKWLAFQARQSNNLKTFCYILYKILTTALSIFFFFFTALYTSEYPNDSVILDSFFFNKSEFTNFKC